MSLRAIPGGRSNGRGGSGALHLLVIDPRSLTRDCMVAALSGAVGVHSVLAAGTPEEAAVLLAEDRDVSVALINLASDAFDRPGLSRAIQPLQQAAPDSNILVLTALIDSEHAHTALGLGVSGLLSSEMSFDLTLDVIRIVSRGWVVYPHSLLSLPVSDQILMPSTGNYLVEEILTSRQRQVLEGLSRGLTNRQIASHLFVTERTVKSHVKELMRRLGASNRTQVVAIAGRTTKAEFE